MQRRHATSGGTRTALTREPPTRGNVGPDRAVMACHPTLYGWCLPQDTCHHAPCHRWRHAWLGGLGFCGDRCQGTAVWHLGLPLSGSLQEAAAEQIEVCPPKHLTFQHFQAVDVPLNGTRTPRQGHPSFDGIV